MLHLPVVASGGMQHRRSQNQLQQRGRRGQEQRRNVPFFCSASPAQGAVAAGGRGSAGVMMM